MELTVQYYSPWHLDDEGNQMRHKSLCFNHAHNRAHNHEVIETKIVSLSEFTCDDCTTHVIIPTR